MASAPLSLPACPACDGWGIETLHDEGGGETRHVHCRVCGGDGREGASGRTHLSAAPFVAACGADVPNQRTTTVRANVTCPCCLRGHWWRRGKDGARGCLACDEVREE